MGQDETRLLGAGGRGVDAGFVVGGFVFAHGRRNHGNGNFRLRALRFVHRVGVAQGESLYPVHHFLVIGLVLGHLDDARAAQFGVGGGHVHFPDVAQKAQTFFVVRVALCFRRRRQHDALDVLGFELHCSAGRQARLWHQQHFGQAHLHELQGSGVFEMHLRLQHRQQLEMRVRVGVLATREHIGDFAQRAACGPQALHGGIGRGQRQPGVRTDEREGLAVHGGVGAAVPLGRGVQKARIGVFRLQDHVAQLDAIGGNGGKGRNLGHALARGHQRPQHVGHRLVELGDFHVGVGHGHHAWGHQLLRKQRGRMGFLQHQWGGVGGRGAGIAYHAKRCVLFQQRTGDELLDDVDGAIEFLAFDDGRFAGEQLGGGGRCVFVVGLHVVEGNGAFAQFAREIGQLLGGAVVDLQFHEVHLVAKNLLFGQMDEVMKRLARAHGLELGQVPRHHQTFGFHLQNQGGHVARDLRAFVDEDGCAAKEFGGGQILVEKSFGLGHFVFAFFVGGKTHDALDVDGKGLGRLAVQGFAQGRCVERGSAPVDLARGNAAVEHGVRRHGHGPVGGGEQFFEAFVQAGADFAGGGQHNHAFFSLLGVGNHAGDER